MLPFLNNINWVPKKIGVFAGKIDYPSYKFFDKYAIKFIMWITNGPTDTSKTFEFTDWKKVEEFTKNLNLSTYEQKFKESWVYKELHEARNVKPSFSWGLILGILFTGIDQILLKH